MLYCWYTLTVRNRLYYLQSIKYLHRNIVAILSESIYLGLYFHASGVGLPSNDRWAGNRCIRSQYSLSESTDCYFFLDAEEYCLPEVFHAECASTELIVVDRALFGRMELGRCVTRNYGHVGCAVDVLPAVDQACSGRRTCDLSVSDPALVRTKPCPKDFASYLDADYSCVPC